MDKDVPVADAAPVEAPAEERARSLNVLGVLLGPSVEALLGGERRGVGPVEELAQLHEASEGEPEVRQGAASRAAGNQAGDRAAPPPVSRHLSLHTADRVASSLSGRRVERRSPPPPAPPLRPASAAQAQVHVVRYPHLEDLPVQLRSGRVDTVYLSAGVPGDYSRGDAGGNALHTALNPLSFICDPKGAPAA